MKTFSHGMHSFNFGSVMLSRLPRRGEIWRIDLDPTCGSEIEKHRPCILLTMDDVLDIFFQEDMGGNLNAPNGYIVLVAPITNKALKFERRGLTIDTSPYGLTNTTGKVNLCQMRTIDMASPERNARFSESGSISLANDCIRKFIKISHPKITPKSSK